MLIKKNFPKIETSMYIVYAYPTSLILQRYLFLRFHDFV